MKKNLGELEDGPTVYVKWQGQSTVLVLFVQPIRCRYWLAPSLPFANFNGPETNKWPATVKTDNSSDQRLPTISPQNTCVWRNLLASQPKLALNVVSFTSQRFLLFNRRSLYVVSNRNWWSSSTVFRTKKNLWITKCYSKTVTYQIQYKFNPGITQILMEFRLLYF